MCAVQDVGGFQDMLAQQKGAVSLLVEKTTCLDSDCMRLGQWPPAAWVRAPMITVFVVPCRRLVWRQLML